MNSSRIPPDMDPDDLNFPAVLRLTVASADDAEAMALTSIEDATDGDRSTAVRTFADVTELRRILTERRVEIIQAIMDERPASIRDLADRLDRNYADVHDDVDLLAEYGTVYFRSEGRAKQPVVPYDRVTIDATIAETAPT